MSLQRMLSTKVTIAALLIVVCAYAIRGKTVLLEESDNDTRVMLYVGDTLTVKLKSNSTTGYSWSSAPLPAPLEQLENKSKPGKSGNVGEADFQTFSFKAAKSGEAEILLRYFRPFEKDKPAAKTFRVSVSIEARPQVSAK